MYVNKTTSNVGMYDELGRYPLYVNIVKQCQRYIHHLDNNTQNTLLQKVQNQIILVRILQIYQTSAIMCSNYVMLILPWESPLKENLQHLNYNKDIENIGAYCQNYGVKKWYW
jgi:hypothetical protein